MKKLLLLLLIIPAISFSQAKFKKGVKVLEVTKSSDFKTPKSILFEFTGDTHLINYYLILSKKIKNRAKKNNISVAFNYNLTSKKPLKSDIESIPTIRNNKDNYDVRCVIQGKFKNNPKEWKNYTNIRFRKTRHILTFDMFNQLNIKVFNVIFDIYAYYTITTESKKTSKQFFKLITE